MGDAARVVGMSSGQGFDFRPEFSEQLQQLSTRFGGNARRVLQRGFDLFDTIEDHRAGNIPCRAMQRLIIVVAKVRPRRLDLLEHRFVVMTQAAAEFAREQLENGIPGSRVLIDQLTECLLGNRPDAGSFDYHDVGTGLVRVDQIHFAHGVTRAEFRDLHRIAVGVDGDGEPTLQDDRRS